ncbi:cupin domain-containing protein [Roseovarius sp. 2305UL8-3]|uniref:cupin domain-containing protein n=1 Tax=Roseovarius conchicola TaxID=3121636 RepID=UPI00352889B9
MTQTADQIISKLGLQPHPEGGHYVETWRAEGPGRPAGTAICFLLKGAENNHWHKVDAAEIWHFYAGDPLVLSLSETDEGPAQDHLLGPDLSANQCPQVIVPAGHWQKARCTGDWTLVGCTVSPGFQFESFVLAEPGFDIPQA